MHWELTTTIDPKKEKKVAALFIYFQKNNHKNVTI